MTRAEVVSLNAGRARRRRPARSADSGTDELRRLRSQLGEAREALVRAERQSRRPGLLAGLARLAESGISLANWETLARLQKSLYFAFHSERVDEFGYDPRFAASLEPLLEFLYAVWWRVETVGIEHVPASGAGLVVANHSGVLPWDGLMVKLAIKHQHPARRHCRLLALDMFALLPFLAPMLARHGEIRANPENAERVLREGGLVGVFPEGVKGVGKYYRERYKLARFGRGGFVRVALRTGAPLIPCAVVGAEEIHPVLAKADWIGRPLGLPYFPITPTFPALGPLGVIPLPTKWSIDFSDPVPTEAYGPEAAEDPILVNRLTEQVRTTLQQMIDGRLARRRSVWFG